MKTAASRLSARPVKLIAPDFAINYQIEQAIEIHNTARNVSVIEKGPNPKAPSIIYKAGQVDFQRGT